MTTVDTRPTGGVADDWAEFRAQVDGHFADLWIAEDEIAKAVAAYGDDVEAADRAWHALLALQPTMDKMTLTEMVYRAHCRELLDRAAAAGDLRPGTAVECCIALCEASTAVPLNTTGTGLYFRLWHKAGLPDMGGEAQLPAYERLRAERMDDEEAALRGRLAQPRRGLPDPIEHVRLCPIGLSIPRPDHGYFDQHGRWVTQGLFELEASP